MDEDDWGDVIERCAPKGKVFDYKAHKDKLALLRNKLECPAIDADPVYEKALTKRKDDSKFIPTGIEWWDSFTRRMRRGNTYTLAGYPGVGKTTLALNLAWSLSRSHKVWYYCIEMLSDEVFEVLAGHILKDAEYGEEGEAVAYASMKDRKFLFYEPKGFVPWRDRLNEILLTVRNESIEVVFIDNLSFLIRSEKNTSEVEAMASAEIKGLAQELEIPIILLHHLRKPMSDSTEPEPSMHTQKGSGAILGDASDAWILHHPLTNGETRLRSPYGYVLSGKPRWGLGGKRYVRLEGEQRTYYPSTLMEYKRGNPGPTTNGKRKYEE